MSKNKDLDGKLHTMMSPLFLKSSEGSNNNNDSNINKINYGNNLVNLGNISHINNIENQTIYSNHINTHNLPPYFFQQMINNENMNNTNPYYDLNMLIKQNTQNPNTENNAFNYNYQNNNINNPNNNFHFNYKNYLNKGELNPNNYVHYPLGQIVHPQYLQIPNLSNFIQNFENRTLSDSKNSKKNLLKINKNKILIETKKENSPDLEDNFISK